MRSRSILSARGSQVFASAPKIPWGERVVDQVRGRLFHVVDPARTARGEHRVGAVESVVALHLFKALDEFGAFLENRHVGRPARVTDEVGAELLEAGDEEALEIFARGKPHGFADREAHGRSHLHDGRDRGIFKEFERAFTLILDGDGARRTDERTLAALNAAVGRPPGGAVKADDRFRSEAFERDGAHAVHLSADFEAAKTADALVGREGEGGRRRVGAVTVHEATREARDVEPHGLRDRLEFAVAVARALRAALAVVGKEEFRLELTHAAQLRARRAHAKAFLHARVAGRDGAGAVLLHDFRETHAAGPRTVVKRREFAERRNENPFAAGDLENRFAFGEADGDVVQKCFHLLLPDQSSSSLFPGMGRSVETAKIR